MLWAGGSPLTVGDTSTRACPEPKRARRSAVTELTPLPVADPAAELPPRDGPGRRASLGMQLVLLVAIILPFLGLVAAPFFLWGWGFSWPDLGLLVGMYVL